MSTSETLPRRGRDLQSRYTAADVGVLTPDEVNRFVRDGAGDPQTDIALAWELLYRLEPDLYDRLVMAERLHSAVVGWLPDDVDRIVEVAAGTGRLTLELVSRAREVVAIEPAAPLREVLSRKCARTPQGHRARVTHGFFDDLPVGDGCADLVVSCSALTPAPEHGGDTGLREMERACRPGGRVVIVWPNALPWLASHGYQHVTFGDAGMFVEFASHQEAAELTEIFYPAVAAEVRRRRWRRVPYEALGINPPCDLAFKVIT